jgi:hypothetical protein
MDVWVCGAFAWEAFKRLQRSDADGDAAGGGYWTIAHAARYKDQDKDFQAAAVRDK